MHCGAGAAPQLLRNRTALGERSESPADFRRNLRIEPSPGSKRLQAPATPANPAMRAHVSVLPRIAASDVPVLITGESGVGKEVFARQLHAKSPRAGRPFLKLNCAAMPADLLESELFGYEKGAFTGAYQTKPGKFELANGGIILLDEIGDMEFRLQAKLLQVLQDHEFQRVGGKETIRVDVRLLAATHQDLDEMMRCGRFREDLYYRLNVINICIPPLRERRDEILPLAEHFMRQYRIPNSPNQEIPPLLRKALLDHDWPGNIRELENMIRRYLVVQDVQEASDELTNHQRKRQEPPASVDAAPKPEPAASPELASTLSMVEERKNQAEAEIILDALYETRWNRRKAAVLLNIEYRSLIYRMKKLGIGNRSQSERR